MQKREFLKGSLAALGVFGCGVAAARSEFPEARDITQNGHICSCLLCGQSQS